MIDVLNLIPETTAVDAALPVNTDHSAAFRALPSILLLGDECLEPKLFYVLQVLYHTHTIIRSVSLVQLP